MTLAAVIVLGVAGLCSLGAWQSRLGIPARSALTLAAVIALVAAAVALTSLAGFPEGLAVVVAVKALGRYPELRGPGVSERFIIGTLASLLWAGGVAGVGVSIFGGGPLTGGA